MFTLPTTDQVPCEVISHMLSLFLTLFPTPHSCKVNINPLRQMEKLKVEKCTHSNRKIFSERCTVQAPFQALGYEHEQDKQGSSLHSAHSLGFGLYDRLRYHQLARVKTKEETDLKEIAKVPFWRYVQCLAYWMAIGCPNRDIKWSEIYESSQQTVSPRPNFSFTYFLYGL